MFSYIRNLGEKKTMYTSPQEKQFMGDGLTRTKKN